MLGRSAEIGDAMAAAMLDAAKPGVVENEVYAAGMAEAFRRGTIAPPMIFQAGPGTIAWGTAGLGVSTAGAQGAPGW